MMDRERIERVARKIARVHMDEPDGMVRAVVDGIEWVLTHQEAVAGADAGDMEKK